MFRDVNSSCKPYNKGFFRSDVKMLRFKVCFYFSLYHLRRYLGGIIFICIGILVWKKVAPMKRESKLESLPMVEKSRSDFYDRVIDHHSKLNHR